MLSIKLCTEKFIDGTFGVATSLQTIVLTLSLFDLMVEEPMLRRFVVVGTIVYDNLSKLSIMVSK